MRSTCFEEQKTWLGLDVSVQRMMPRFGVVVLPLIERSLAMSTGGQQRLSLTVQLY